MKSIKLVMQKLPARVWKNSGTAADHRPYSSQQYEHSKNLPTGVFAGKRKTAQRIAVHDRLVHG